MDRKTYKETGRFKLKTEDGREFVAVETTEFLHVESHSGSSIIAGLKQLETSEGYRITPAAEGKFKILDLGQIASRV